MRFPPDTRRFFGVPYSWAGFPASPCVCATSGKGTPERLCACADAASGKSFGTLASGNPDSASSTVKSTAIAITCYRFLIPKMLHTCNFQLLSTHEILNPTNLTTQTTEQCTQNLSSTEATHSRLPHHVRTKAPHLKVELDL